MAATVLCPELVAAAANMLAAAWAAAEIGAPAQPVPDAATGKPPAPEAREVSQDERRDQDSGRSPRADRGDLRAPVHDGPGPRPHRVHRTSVRPGRRGAAAERGELATPLPVGYCRDEEGDVIVDPDEEVPARSRRCSLRSPRPGRPT